LHWFIREEWVIAEGKQVIPGEAPFLAVRLSSAIESFVIIDVMVVWLITYIDPAIFK